MDGIQGASASVALNSHADKPRQAARPEATSTSDSSGPAAVVSLSPKAQSVVESQAAGGGGSQSDSGGDKKEGGSAAQAKSAAGGAAASSAAGGGAAAAASPQAAAAIQAYTRGGL